MTLLAAASIAQAQGTQRRAEQADPLDAQARVPAVTHRSPLAAYHRLGDHKPVSWKEANETVNRIGGWRAYAREAQQPEPAASAPAARGSTAPPPGSAPSHSGHRMH
jgi:hypothetical protein